MGKKEKIQNMLADYPESLKTVEVAKILNCSKRHVHNLIERGVLQAVDIGDSPKKKLWRIMKVDLENYLLKNN